MTTISWRCNSRCLPDLSKGYPQKPAVFFDRDGTLIAEEHYLHNPAELKLFPETIPGLQRLRQAGLSLYIFTNQAGVAHGYFTEADLHLLHQELVQRIAQGGASLNGIFYCPHHPEAKLQKYRFDCFGRKPNPGLLYLAACRDHLDLSNSFVIGDKLTDLKAGKQTGAATILVLTGYGEQELTKITPETQPDLVAANLTEATEWILERVGSNRTSVSDQHH
ncbi:MAG TPA: HAD family hydrolase [Bacillota bacterium]